MSLKKIVSPPPSGRRRSWAAHKYRAEIERGEFQCREDKVVGFQEALEARYRLTPEQLTAKIKNCFQEFQRRLSYLLGAGVFGVKLEPLPMDHKEQRLAAQMEAELPQINAFIKRIEPLLVKNKTALMSQNLFGFHQALHDFYTQTSSVQSTIADKNEKILKVISVNQEIRSITENLDALYTVLANFESASFYSEILSNLNAILDKCKCILNSIDTIKSIKFKNGTKNVADRNIKSLDPVKKELGLLQEFVSEQKIDFSSKAEQFLSLQNARIVAKLPGINTFLVQFENNTRTQLMDQLRSIGEKHPDLREACETCIRCIVENKSDQIMQLNSLSERIKENSPEEIEQFTIYCTRQNAFRQLNYAFLENIDRQNSAFRDLGKAQSVLINIIHLIDYQMNPETRPDTELDSLQVVTAAHPAPLTNESADCLRDICSNKLFKSNFTDLRNGLVNLARLHKKISEIYSEVITGLAQLPNDHTISKIFQLNIVYLKHIKSLRKQVVEYAAQKINIHNQFSLFIKQVDPIISALDSDICGFNGLTILSIQWLLRIPLIQKEFFKKLSEIQTDQPDYLEMRQTIYDMMDYFRSNLEEMNKSLN